jgi:hypothetical protein
LNILMPSMPVNSTKAANKAKAVNAADALANPFPIAEASIFRGGLQ